MGRTPRRSHAPAAQSGRPGSRRSCQARGQESVTAAHLPFSLAPRVRRHPTRAPTRMISYDGAERPGSCRLQIAIGGGVYRRNPPKTSLELVAIPVLNCDAGEQGSELCGRSRPMSSTRNRDRAKARAFDAAVRIGEAVDRPLEDLLQLAPGSHELVRCRSWETTGGRGWVTVSAPTSIRSPSISSANSAGETHRRAAETAGVLADDGVAKPAQDVVPVLLGKVAHRRAELEEGGVPWRGRVVSIRVPTAMARKIRRVEHRRVAERPAPAGSANLNTGRSARDRAGARVARARPTRIAVSRPTCPLTTKTVAEVVMPDGRPGILEVVEEPVVEMTAIAPGKPSGEAGASVRVRTTRPRDEHLEGLREMLGVTVSPEGSQSSRTTSNGTCAARFGPA